MATDPRWEPDEAVRRGGAAWVLATEHAGVMSARLDAGVLDQLKRDYQALGGVGDLGPLTAQKIATRTEREVADDAHDLIGVFRELVQRSKAATSTLRTAIGVGDGLKATDTERVLNVLDQIVLNEPGLLACGATAEEVDEAEALAISLRGADDAQTTSVGARSIATNRRADAQLRLEAAVDQIYSRGRAAFRKNSAVRARFERLVSADGPTAEEEAPRLLDPPVPA